MKISLIIRVYNEEQNILHCLNSITRQKLKPEEIFIIDNGSTDATLHIAKSYNKQALKIIHNPVKGYSSGLNLGIKHSNYNYICFLSADCFPHPDWLIELSKTMTMKKCAVVQGVEIPYPTNDIHYVLEKERIPVQHEQPISFFTNTNTLYIKSELLPFLPFNDVDNQGGEDTVMSIKYKKSGLAAYITPKAIVYHNMFPSVDDFKRRMINHGRLAAKIFKLFPNYPRIYLNSFYWSIKEFILFIKTRDQRYWIVAYIRLIYTLKGALSVIKVKNDSRQTI